MSYDNNVYDFPTAADYADAYDDLGAERPSYEAQIINRLDLATLPQPKPLIADTLDKSTLVMLYGESGIGKSFVALDWAMSIASGLDWQGRDTQQARVLYVYAEGDTGILRRVDAWESAWNQGRKVDGIDFLPQPVNLSDDESVCKITRSVELRQPGLVIFDTMARCMSGDENTARDAGAVIRALDSVRLTTPGGQGTVVVVHHTGYDKSGARGSSSIYGAMDTVYGLHGLEAGIRLRREKRKDGPLLDSHDLKLTPVMQSLIVEVSRYGDPTQHTVEIHAGKIYKYLRSIPDGNSVSLGEIAEATGLSRDQAHPALKPLVDSGRVSKVGGGRSTRYALA